MITRISGPAPTMARLFWENSWWLFYACLGLTGPGPPGCVSFIFPRRGVHECFRIDSFVYSARFQALIIYPHSTQPVDFCSVIKRKEKGPMYCLRGPRVCLWLCFWPHIQ